MPGLIDDADLELSPVVANNAMNRGRGLAGVNGYGRELGFDVLEFLRRRLAANGRVAWLDLCCGEGRAVIEGAAVLAGGDPVTVIGVDLVDAFAVSGRLPHGLELVTASVVRWEPVAGQLFDLVTCVHGLHYVGDKLGLLARVAAWTAPDGVFAASFDPAAIRHDGSGASGRPASRRVLRTLRDAGAAYDPRRHLLSWRGPVALDFGARYTGADAAAGPGYTGMDSVDSAYLWDGRRRIS
jgi:SAM-dependent methyltransferase